MLLSVPTNNALLPSTSMSHFKRNHDDIVTILQPIYIFFNLCVMCFQKGAYSLGAATFSALSK